MTDDNDYFAWLNQGDRIRISARAIIFNQAGERILIERNRGDHNEFANFIGGGVQVGESLRAGLEREVREETNARVLAARYLFVVENFIRHQTEIRHALEHYFEVKLDREDVVPREAGLAYSWVAVADLAGIDLRPVVVRDRIVAGTYRQVGHLIIGEPGT